MMDEDKDTAPRLLFVKTKGSFWRLVLVAFIVCVFFLLLAPGRPLQCIQILFGLDPVALVTK